MKLEAVENDGRLIVDMGQNHTLGNLIRKAIWENEGEAAYDTGHPLGEESNLIVEADNPEEVLEAAVETARDWLEQFEDQL